MNEWDLLEGTRMGNTQTYQCQIGHHVESTELNYCAHCGFSFVELSDELTTNVEDVNSFNDADSDAANINNF